MSLLVEKEEEVLWDKIKQEHQKVKKGRTTESKDREK